MARKSTYGTVELKVTVQVTGVHSGVVDNFMLEKLLTQAFEDIVKNGSYETDVTISLNVDSQKLLESGYNT